MNTANKLCFGLVALLGISTLPVEAAVVYDQATFGPGLVVDFEDAIVPANAPNGPVDVGGAIGYQVWASSQGGPLSLGDGGYFPLGSNGAWSLGNTFAGVTGGINDYGEIPSLTFDFGELKVQKIGGFFSYDPDDLVGGVPPLLAIYVYDADGNEVDFPAFVNPVSDEDYNDGAFYGFVLDAPVISRMVVSGSFAVVDDLTFSAPVPEPTTYALLLAGLGVIGVVAARRRR